MPLFSVNYFIDYLYFQFKFCHWIIKGEIIELFFNVRHPLREILKVYEEIAVITSGIYSVVYYFFFSEIWKKAETSIFRMPKKYVLLELKKNKCLFFYFLLSQIHISSRISIIFNKNCIFFSKLNKIWNLDIDITLSVAL